ncbi:MAG: uroporphyrinogen-III synthase [Lachnospiraceae bacterium]
MLLPRAAAGSSEILEALLERKDLRVDDVATYETFLSQEVIDQKAEFEAGEIACAVFTSASTVRGFAEAVPGLDYTKVKAACIGRQTKAAADRYGMETYMASKATMESLEELVEKNCKNTGGWKNGYDYKTQKTPRK